jgi:hypothetical protein
MHRLRLGLPRPAAAALLLILLPLARGAPAGAATLSLPADAGAPGATSVIVPLTIDESDGVLGTDLLIGYDPSVALAIGVTAASLAAGQTLTVNLSTPGALRIALFGPQPLTGGGVLLELRFESTGPPGSSTPLEFVLADLNEGEIPATVVDGGFCVLDHPPETQNLGLTRVAGSTTARLTWNPQPFALAYNVYRAGRANLGDLGCMLAGATTTSVLDDGAVPPAGQCRFYLVTSVACSGESTLGFTSSGAERLSASACP